MRVLATIVGLLAFAVGACGNSSDASTGGGPGSDGGASTPARDAAADAAGDAAADAGPQLAPCTASFGAPAMLASAPEGTEVVLEGTLVRASNIVEAEPKGSTCTDGSRAVELVTTGDTQAVYPVLVADASGTTASCGCADTESALCAHLAFGPKLRVRGKLTHTASQGPCNQNPCRALTFADACAVVP